MQRMVPAPLEEMTYLERDEARILRMDVHLSYLPRDAFALRVYECS